MSVKNSHSTHIQQYKEADPGLLQHPRWDVVAVLDLPLISILRRAMYIHCFSTPTELGI